MRSKGYTYRELQRAFVGCAVIITVIVYIWAFNIISSSKQLHVRAVAANQPNQKPPSLASEQNGDKEGLSETTQAAQLETAPIVTVAIANEFGYRKQVLQRACSMLRAIEKVKKTGTFEELVMLHRLIQDVHVKIDGVADKDDCIPERYGKGGHSGNPVFKLEGPALKTSGAEGLLVCLPPKCGTTNYQKALAPLKVNFDEGEMKPSTVPEDFHAPSVYSVLPRLANLDWISFKDKEFLARYKSTMNVRNPFSRLYSAWNDKFRTFLTEDGKVDWRTDENNFAHRKEHVTKYHNVYFDQIAPFEDPSKPPDHSRNVTFEAFIAYIATSKDQGDFNWHWKSFFWHCAPCHLNYELITQLENATQEGPQLLKEIGVDQFTHIPGQYSKSPLKKNEPEFYWKNVPKENIKEIYRVYFEDFLLGGYSAENVLKFVDAGTEIYAPPSPESIAASKAASEEMRRAKGLSLKSEANLCRDSN